MKITVGCCDVCGAMRKLPDDTEPVTADVEDADPVGRCALVYAAEDGDVVECEGDLWFAGYMDLWDRK